MKKRRNVIFIYLFMTACWIIWFIINNYRVHTEVDWLLVVYTLILGYIWSSALIKKAKSQEEENTEDLKQRKMNQILQSLSSKEFKRVELRKLKLVRGTYAFDINKMLMNIIENENILFYAKAEKGQILIIAKNDEKIVYSESISDPEYFENYFRY